ncbi:MAG: hypothetical protein Q9164_005036 [Protoblastenia rupestris]
MLPPIPRLEDYDVSVFNGFLPDEPPLEVLPDPYYEKWEAIVKHLQALLLCKRLREVVQDLPVITTSRLRRPAEWRRAYVLLSFMAHAYIWGGDRPEERVPPSISIPFLQVCRHLDLPTVATYAGVCLWNWKPIFDDEGIDTLDNLSTLVTFTGSLDESWFYLVSVAMEARGGPIIPLMLRAIAAARTDDAITVTECLHGFAERLDELGNLMQQMYENCDPHVFYHRIRPFLAGSKNMADAGLPNGVIFDTGSGQNTYCKYGGGSNAQSALIQFFDIILGIEHHPTGSRKTPDDSGYTENEVECSSTAPPPRHNFIHDMRSYMPGPHRRFLSHVTSVANIRQYVDSHRSNRPLTIAYDACLAMLRTLRNKHMQMVSRYIVVKSHESRHTRSLSPRAAPHQPQPLNLANAHITDGKPDSKKLRGTGGTALIPFLKQARDETGEPAVDDWFRRTLSNSQAHGNAGKSTTAARGFAPLGKLGEHPNGDLEIVGLSGVWKVDDSEGGICHW